MKLSQVGINLIKSFEGCRLVAYKALPSEKYYTIGWGHYGSDVSQNEVITQPVADRMLLDDLATYEDSVNKYVNIALNQYQFDALVSFTYNCGSEALRDSTLLQKLNKGDFAGASAEFDLWIHSGGQVIQGLVNRRMAEKALFNKPVPAQYQTYTIRSGENLTVISKRFNTTIQNLLNLNPSIKNKNLIYAGQQIKVPAK